MAKKKDLNITSKEIQDFFRATGKSPSGSPLEQGLINIYPEAALISNPFKGVVTSSPLGISLGKKAAVKTIRALDPIYRASETLNKGIYDTAKKGYKKVYDYTLERTPEEYKSTVGKAFKDTWKTLNSENVIPLYPALFNPNNYADGGSLLNKLGKWNTAATSKLMGSSFGQGLDKLGISQDNLGGIANTAVSTISGFMNPSGNQTGIGNTMQTIGGIASNIPGVGGLIGAGVNLLGGLTNAAFGSNINEEFVDQTKEDIKNQSNYISEASTNAELLADFSTHRDLANVTKDQVGTEGWFSSKASRITNQLNKDIDKANTRAWMSLGNTAFNVDKMNDLMAMQNISAYGGPIHIKKENRGKFTDYCGGKVTNECIQKGLNSPNPLTRKRANFARNARGWSHADGGPFINKNDNIVSTIPLIIEPVERTVDGKKWSELLPYERLNIQTGKTSQGYPIEKPLEIVSPEFDVLTGIRSIFNLPKGFLKGNGKISTKPNKYYRQVRKEDKGIERAKSLGVIDTKPSNIKTSNNKIALRRKETFDVPFFSRDNLWYGKDPRYDVIIGDSKDFEWMPLTKHGSFRPDVIDQIDTHVRATPLVNGVPNKAASSSFQYYRNYPIIGMRDVTEGFPTIPLTGLNTLTEANEKAEGGFLDTNFSNGINIIGNGGTHQQNNLGGVQMGVDQNGIPNLVEEGEVIWNNYVFSNRLKVPKDMREKYKLHKDITFANAAKKLQKESEERPNDPISKRGLDAVMQDIMTSQEGVRQQSNNTSSNKFAEGGPVRDSRWDFTPTILPDKIEPFSAYGLTFGNKKPFTKGQGDLYTRNMRNYGKTINGQEIKDSWLRKLPIGMAGTSVISDIFSKPDYSAVDRIASVDLNPSLVGFNPIGQRLTYKPMDVDYRTNQLLSKSAATDRNILNTSGGNRAAAMAGLLASEYNTQLGLSELARQADEYNRAQEKRVAGFNRQTDLSNSQMGLQAAMANQQARNNATQLRLNQADRVAMLRQAAKDRYDARRSNNMNLLIQGLADLGREETQRNWLDWLGEKGVLKVDSKGNITTGDTKACGGKLRTRKKKGYTYG